MQINHTVGYLQLVVIHAIQIALMVSCGCHVVQPRPVLLPINGATFAGLEIQHESYVAFDSVAFFPMRSRWAARPLAVKVDSAFITTDYNTLICYGHVFDDDTQKPLKGIHVWSGRVWEEMANVRRDSGIGAGPLPLYYMYPGIQSVSDEQGSFKIHAPLVGNSYLALFGQGYFATVFEVALLMPDSIRLRLPNPGGVLRGGRIEG